MGWGAGSIGAKSGRESGNWDSHRGRNSEKLRKFYKLMKYFPKKQEPVRKAWKTGVKVMGSGMFKCPCPKVVFLG